MYRTKSFDQDLSEKLQNRRFAQSFLLTLMEGEEALSAEDALRETISRMGVKEFSELAGVAPSNVVDFLRGKRNPKPETLDTYLRPFGLKTKIVLEKAS